MEQRTTNLDMLNEVCHDLRLDWPGSARDRRGKSRYGSEESVSQPTQLSHGD
jgi:hypothetical protein